MTSALAELTNTIPHAVYRFFNRDAELKDRVYPCCVVRLLAEAEGLA